MYTGGFNRIYQDLEERIHVPSVEKLRERFAQCLKDRKNIRRNLRTQYARDFKNRAVEEHKIRMKTNRAHATIITGKGAQPQGICHLQKQTTANITSPFPTADIDRLSDRRTHDCVANFDGEPDVEVIEQTLQAERSREGPIPWQGLSIEITIPIDREDEDDSLQAPIEIFRNIYSFSGC